MKLRTFLIVLCLATVSGATTFTANLKTLHGQVLASEWVVITPKGCGSFVPVTGSGATLPAPLSLYPDNMGAISWVYVWHVYQAQWESPLFGLFHAAAFSIAYLPTNSAIEPLS